MKKKSKDLEISIFSGGRGSGKIYSSLKWFFSKILRSPRIQVIKPRSKYHN